MESRKLGNNTKMIKLMSKVGNYGLIILTSWCVRMCVFSFSRTPLFRYESQLAKIVYLSLRTVNMHIISAMHYNNL